MKDALNGMPLPDKPSRGVYYVHNADLPAFMRGVSSSYQVTLGLFSWSYSKVGTSRDGVVNTWLVVLQ